MSPPSETPGNDETFDRAMYLDILKDDPPMKRYVSRGDTPDDIDIQGPHEEADRAIFRAVRFTMSDGTPRFQPILGSAGMGKTHLYWAIKDREEIFSKGPFRTVYVPSPPAPVRVPLHFHACLVDEMGEDLFEQTIDMLIQKFGGLKGVTHEVYDYTYAMERLLTEYPGISADVVKVLLRYRLDPPTHDLARRWLLGDALSDEEIERLDVRTILEEDDVTLATLRLLLEGSEIPVVFFIDEMEGPYNTHGEEGEKHFLEVIKRIYNEGKNVVILASCLTEIWDRIYEVADGPMRSRMETPTKLRHFTKEDIRDFIEKSMTKYWEEKNVDPPPDLIFPLTSEDIEGAFTKSQGIPREAIRFIIPRIDEILFGESVEVEEQSDYVIKLTASVVIGAIASALEIVSKSLDITVQLHVAKGDMSKQATAVLKIIKGEQEKLLCIDVANVKDWDRSGGVAAYYSVKRLKEIVDAGEASIAIIAVPEETGGTKYKAMSEDMGTSLKTLHLTEATGKALVEATNKGALSDEHSTFFRDILGGMF